MRVHALVLVLVLVLVPICKMGTHTLSCMRQQTGIAFESVRSAKNFQEKRKSLISSNY